MKILNGTLDGAIFENANAGISAKLKHRIRVELEPLDGYEKFEMELDFISHPDIRSWRDLEKRTFEFPINPQTGYIDGSTYLHGAHIYVDVTSISFGERTGVLLPISLRAVINFEASGISGVENIEDLFQGSVEIQNLRILECLFPGLDDARARSLLAHYSRSEDYLGPVRGPDFYDFKPTITNQERK